MFDEVDGCGMVTPPGDAAAFASAIEGLIDDADMRAQLGAAAQERARERWSRAAILARFHDELVAVARRA